MAALLVLWHSMHAFIFIARGCSPWHESHPVLCFAWLKNTKSGSTKTGFSGVIFALLGKSISEWHTSHF